MIRPSEWVTVQRDLNAVRHAAHIGQERVLCSGPKVMVMQLGLIRKPTSVERLLCQVTCLTCMRQLLRLHEGWSLPHASIEA